MLFDNNTIYFSYTETTAKIYKLQNELSDLTDIDHNPTAPSSTPSHIVCIRGIVYWYDKENDCLPGIKLVSGTYVILFTFF